MPIFKGKLKEEFYCALTFELMGDPVIAFDGFTYERTAIETWFKDKDKSPRAGTTITNKTLIPNQSVKMLLDAELQEKQICSKEKFTKAVNSLDIPAFRELIYFESYWEEFSQKFEGKLWPLVILDNIEEVIKKLAKTCVNYQDSYGRTPLHLALLLAKDQNDDLYKLIHLLLANGAQIDIPDENGWTALHYATYKEFDRIVTLFLSKRIKINARITVNDEPWIQTEKDQPPRSQYPTGRLKEITPTANRLGFIPIEFNNGATALHMAAALGNLSLVKILLGKGASPNEKDDHELTPIMNALQNLHLEVASFICKHSNFHIKHQSCLYEINDYHQDPRRERVVSSVFKKGYIELAELLIHFQAECFVKDGKKIFVNILHDVAESNKIRTMMLLLTNNRERVNYLEGNGETPLHGAVLKGHFEMSMLLLANGANVNARDEYDQTPLHLATRENHIALIQLFLNHYAEVNAIKKGGALKTALHIAAKNGNIEAVRLLLAKGADPFIPDYENQTALAIAIKSENCKPELIKLLTEYENSFTNPYQRTMEEIERAEQPTTSGLFSIAQRMK